MLWGPTDPLYLAPAGGSIKKKKKKKLYIWLNLFIFGLRGILKKQILKIMTVCKLPLWGKKSQSSSEVLFSGPLETAVLVLASASDWLRSVQ